MSRTMLLRSAAGGLLAAGLFVITTVLDVVAPVQNPYTTAGDVLHQALLVVAFGGAAVAIVGIAMVLRGTGRLTTLALIAAVLAGGGYAAIGVLSLVDLLQGERTLITARLVAAGLLLIGSLLLGVLVLITRALPWWCGVLLIIAFPLGDVVSGLLGTGEGLVLALLWGAVGVALLRRSSTSAQPRAFAGRREQVVR